LIDQRHDVIEAGRLPPQTEGRRIRRESAGAERRNQHGSYLQPVDRRSAQHSPSRRLAMRFESNAGYSVHPRRRRQDVFEFPFAEAWFPFQLARRIDDTMRHDDDHGFRL
jgi:hypothetical protein